MDHVRLWQELLAHPMSGWLAPQDPVSPPISQVGRLVWCGIGGSLLPTQSLVAALGTPSQRHRLVALASPEFADLHLEPEDQVVFASKSGRTLELWTWISRLRALPGWGHLKAKPIVITQVDDNPLAQWARSEGWKILPIPDCVGGRYSAFTGVGTLPIQWMGRNSSAFVKGARQAASEVRRGEGLWGGMTWRALEGMAAAYAQGFDRWVFLPYASRLETLGGWWVQLVAESLGKPDRTGQRHGITPIRALGPHDQHAQLQRWLGGAQNVGVVLVTVDGCQGQERLAIPEHCPFPQLGRWKGREILMAQADGTRETLEAAGVPVISWHLQGLDEETLGAFQMSWQLLVSLLGLHWGVDPFDQPAVEEGKRRTLQKLGA